MQPLTVARVRYCTLQRRKEENLIEYLYLLPYGLRNPYINLKSENTKDYAQKPQRNCTFMNSASEAVTYEWPWLLQGRRTEEARPGSLPPRSMLLSPLGLAGNGEVLTIHETEM
jgi:hypothetical protein